MAVAKADQREQPSVDLREAAEDEWYDLLPVEKKLIFYTLGLGLVLLVIFVFLFGIVK